MNDFKRTVGCIWKNIRYSTFMIITRKPEERFQWKWNPMSSIIFKSKLKYVATLFESQVKMKRENIRTGKDCLKIESITMSALDKKIPFYVLIWWWCFQTIIWRRNENNYCHRRCCQEYDSLLDKAYMNKIWGENMRNIVSYMRVTINNLQFFTPGQFLSKSFKLILD